MNSNPIPSGVQQIRTIPAGEAMELLGSVSYGRLICTVGGQPTARPVNHIVDEDAVVICAELAALYGADGTDHTRLIPVTVAYQADKIDPLTWEGWTVTLTGHPQPVTDPTAYPGLVDHWGDCDTLAVLHPELVIGTRVSPLSQPAATSDDQRSD